MKFTENQRTGDYGMATRPAQLWFPLLLVFLALLVATSTVRAHGGSGYYYIRGEPMGDYTVHVWISPGLLRTGEVHVDTAVFDATGAPALHTLVMVTFTPLDVAPNAPPPPATAMASTPYGLYPYTREARFNLAMPGEYRVDIALMDADGMVGVAGVDVDVQTIAESVKLVIIALGVLTLACGLWLLVQMRNFWSPRGRRLPPDAYRKPMKTHMKPTVYRTHRTPDHSRGFDAGFAAGIEWPTCHGQYIEWPTCHGKYMEWPTCHGKYMEKMSKGGLVPMAATHDSAARGLATHDTQEGQRRSWYARLNGPYHARALWIFMLIVVAHWMEHVLQIYQIYGLGWAPAAAGGLIGVFYPILITSETLHFVYDFIQWAGIVVLRGGFRGRARSYWNIAMVAQTWHFIEHVLLMGQYLTGYYLFGRVKQTSILELFFPREELHFFYNLIVFVPMVIAVHYYMRRQRAQDAGQTEAAAIRVKPHGPAVSMLLHAQARDLAQQTSLLEEEMDVQTEDRAPNRRDQEQETPRGVPFGDEGGRFLCNLLQHGVFVGVVVLLLMVINYFGQP